MSNSEHATLAPPPAAAPLAALAPRRRTWWVWLIPLAAALFALALVVTYVLERGERIIITMSHGHGIKAGDVLRCRGIIVGEVETVTLSDDLQQIEVAVRLADGAEDVARAGSRFWVVRPRFSLTQVAGLETIVGARYLAVLPGPRDGLPGARLERFAALEQAPVVESIAPDGLEVTLIADSRRSLSAGAPIHYRQVRIGTVLAVGLSSDAASVEARGYIEPAYVALVRDNSRFWNQSGIDMEVGIRGLRLELESLQTILDAGVALATPAPPDTPDKPGEPVHTGHRFVLHESPERDWLDWQPQIVVGAQLLPAGVPQPELVRVTVTRDAGLFSRTKRRKGWLLPTSAGLWGPAPLLAPGAGAGGDDAVAELMGQKVQLTPHNVRTVGNLAVLTLPSPANAGGDSDADAEGAPAAATLDPWPAARIRTMAEPEACVILTGPASPPIPIAAARLERHDDAWTIDPMVSLDATLSGAAVVARRDGFVVGLLVMGDDRARVVAVQR